MLEELNDFLNRIKDSTLSELYLLKNDCKDIISKYENDEILQLVKIYPKVDELYQMNLKYIEGINQLLIFNLMKKYDQKNFTKYFNEWDMFSLEDKITILEEAISKKIDIISTNSIRTIMEKEE